MIKKIIIWIVFALCITLVIFFAIMAVLADYSHITEIGFSALAVLFLIESIILCKIARNSSKSEIRNTIIHIATFTAVFLIIAFNVNLFHSPTGHFRSKPILAALEAYKYKHNHYPKDLEELEADQAGQSIYSSDSRITYESDGGPYYYKLTVYAGGPLRRRCFYWTTSVGQSRGTLESKCMNSR